MLPPVLKRFRDKYPKVRLHLHQGKAEQIADLAASGLHVIDLHCDVGEFLVQAQLLAEVGAILLR